MQQKAPGASQIGIYRSQGESNITGNQKFEVMDLGKTSVTNFTQLLQNLAAPAAPAAKATPAAKPAAKAKAKGPPGKSSIGIYRNQGESNITGDHKFEVMDLGKTSVTNFTLLLI